MIKNPKVGMIVKVNCTRGGLQKGIFTIKRVDNKPGFSQWSSLSGNGGYHPRSCLIEVKDKKK